MNIANTAARPSIVGDGRSVTARWAQGPTTGCPYTIAVTAYTFPYVMVAGTGTTTNIEANR